MSASEEWTRYSGDVVIKILDVDKDTYIGTVATPHGSRQVAAAMPNEDPFVEQPADTSPDGIDVAAALLLDRAIEDDDDVFEETLISGVAPIGALEECSTVGRGNHIGRTKEEAWG